MVIREIINQAAGNFEKAGIPSSRLDAEILLAFALGCDRLEFYKNPEKLIDQAQQAEFNKLVARRLKWEPVAYITGRKEFWSLVLDVNSKVLIPRPETEVLVEEALNVYKQIAKPEIKILDIGTGSGAIAIALAKEIGAAKIVATDISIAVLAVAGQNAVNQGVDQQIDFREGNLLEPIDDLFDIIISNPPYIAADEYEKLPAGVKDFEPLEALLAGEQGTEFYEKIVVQAARHLEQNGWLLLEIGATQGEKIKLLIEASGLYDNISIRNDYAQRQRVIKARRKN
jgi:release factor glutamine methyltransferase